jgi:hypothetical protein
MRKRKIKRKIKRKRKRNKKITRESLKKVQVIEKENIQLVNDKYIVAKMI